MEEAHHTDDCVAAVAGRASSQAKWQHYISAFSAAYLSNIYCLKHTGSKTRISNSRITVFYNRETIDPRKVWETASVHGGEGLAPSSWCRCGHNNRTPCLSLRVSSVGRTRVPGGAAVVPDKSREVSLPLARPRLEGHRRGDR